MFQTTVSVSSCLSVDSQTTSSILSAPGQWPHLPPPSERWGDGWKVRMRTVFPLFPPSPSLSFMSCWRSSVSCLNVHVELFSCSLSFYYSYILFPILFHFHLSTHILSFALSLCVPILKPLRFLKQTNILKTTVLQCAWFDLWTAITHKLLISVHNLVILFDQIGKS